MYRTHLGSACVCLVLAQYIICTNLHTPNSVAIALQYIAVYVHNIMSCYHPNVNVFETFLYVLHMHIQILLITANNLNKIALKVKSQARMANKRLIIYIIIPAYVPYEWYIWRTLSLVV